MSELINREPLHYFYLVSFVWSGFDGEKKHGTIEIGLERKWHPFITNAIDQYIKEQINVPVDIFAVTSVFELGLYKKSQINELKRQGEMMYQSLVSSQLQVRGG